jgi:methylmalonyl-CoA epimerase
MSDNALVRDVLHVGIATSAPDHMLELLGRFGFAETSQEQLPHDHAVSRIVSAAGVTVELLTPTDPRSSIASFLEKRGPGLHHLCLRVSNIEAAIATGRDLGLVFLDETPRQDSDGLRIFVHPKSFGGVLLGLVETS